VSGTCHLDCSDEDLKRTFIELGLVTASKSMAPILRQATKAATVSDVTVLIDGETGTGKQVLARAIHKLDQKRRPFPFVTAHCSTISEALAESEFFGHYRGAFTGAVTDRPGLFQAAHHGTLFLDDVNDLPLCVQPKLLDVIQRGALRPVGSDKEVTINVRIVAACNQPLGPLVSQNRFRSDLYHRLNVIRLRLPPLRERPNDLESLILALALRHREVYEPILSVDADLLRMLQGQVFAGNIRELENTVMRMLFQKSHGTSLGLEDWISESDEERSRKEQDPVWEAAEKLWEAISRQGLPFALAIRQLEKQVIETALRTGGSTRRDVAKRLQTSERTLYHKMRAHHLRERCEL
jgi:two-component system response regulator PilR (NtrC family)